MRGLLPMLGAVLGLCAQSPAQPPSKAPPAKATAAKVAEMLDSVKSDEDVARARQELDRLFDEVIAFAPATDFDSFQDAAFGARLAAQLSRAPAGRRADLMAYLRRHDALARTLVFLVKPEDKTEGVYKLLDRLREQRADLPEHASLAAALCVVHDQPLFWRVNENRVESPDPVEIFEYFAAEKRVMAMPVSSLPPELLVYVVDLCASMDDLRWAGQKYACDPDIGPRYFDIKYDTEAFRKGTVKKVTAAGFSLRNVFTYGGVCADQAYFAAHVGKAVGVPTAFISGRNAELSHAWVGFLEVHGNRASWNFDSGRYQGYRGVRGETFDPQVRRRVPDSTLGLLTDASTANAAARRTAVALTDAAVRLGNIAKGEEAFPPAEPAVFKGRKPVRGATLADRLTLLEAGLRRCPSYAPGWAVLVDAAKAGELSYQDKKRWSEVLDRLCAGKYPDFTLDVLRPMVETVDDPKEQSALWDALFSSYQKRPDLAAEVRFAQGAMWEKADDLAKAWDCYQDVIKRFADEGPFAVEAASRCERLLKDSGKTREITPMYGSLWPRLSRPKDMAPEFWVQSNWYRIGMLYAAALDRDGQGGKAEGVRGTLGVSREPANANGR